MKQLSSPTGSLTPREHAHTQPLCWLLAFDCKGNGIPENVFFLVIKHRDWAASLSEWAHGILLALFYLWRQDMRLECPFGLCPAAFPHCSRSPATNFPPDALNSWPATGGSSGCYCWPWQIQALLFNQDSRHNRGTWTSLWEIMAVTAQYRKAIMWINVSEVLFDNLLL